jgi:hypothetical protein
MLCGTLGSFLTKGPDYALRRSRSVATPDLSWFEVRVAHAGSETNMEVWNRSRIRSVLLLQGHGVPQTPLSRDPMGPL